MLKFKHVKNTGRSITYLRKACIQLLFQGHYPERSRPLNLEPMIEVSIIPHGGLSRYKHQSKVYPVGCLQQDTGASLEN